MGNPTETPDSKVLLFAETSKCPHGFSSVAAPINEDQDDCQQHCPTNPTTQQEVHRRLKKGPQRHSTIISGVPKFANQKKKL